MLLHYQPDERQRRCRLCGVLLGPDNPERPAFTRDLSDYRRARDGYDGCVPIERVFLADVEDAALDTPFNRLQPRPAAVPGAAGADALPNAGGSSAGTIAYFEEDGA
jgi:hypothetical protein